MSKPKLTESQRVEIYSRAAWQKDTDERVGAYVAATLGETKEQRTKRGLECKQCFYLRASRIAGQAFTNWKCRICGTERSHHNTAVPRYCDDCAKAHKLCVECGGERT